MPFSDSFIFTKNVFIIDAKGGGSGYVPNTFQANKLLVLIPFHSNDAFIRSFKEFTIAFGAFSGEPVSKGGFGSYSKASCID